EINVAAIGADVGTSHLGARAKRGAGEFGVELRIGGIEDVGGAGSDGDFGDITGTGVEINGQGAIGDAPIAAADDSAGNSRPKGNGGGQGDGPRQRAASG